MLSKFFRKCKLCSKSNNNVSDNVPEDTSNHKSEPPSYNESISVITPSAPIYSHSHSPGMNLDVSVDVSKKISEIFLECMANRDVIIMIDDSFSMNCDDRISQVNETITMIVDLACKYDEDGVDICFLNNVNLNQNVKNSSIVSRMMSLVKWSGSTPIGRCLDNILLKYYTELEKYNKKPISIIIITDGSASDPELLEDTIVKCSKRMENRRSIKQISIQFFQVGDDTLAKYFLKNLDDDLHSKYNIIDIVDCIHSTDGSLTLKERFIKTLIGSVNQQIDETNC
jgi:hypothetical protein